MTTNHLSRRIGEPLRRHHSPVLAVVLAASAAVSSAAACRDQPPTALDASDALTPQRPQALVAQTRRLSDLTTGTRAPRAAGNPAVYVYDAQGTQHVVYRTDTRRIYELYWNGSAGWRAADLTATFGAGGAASDPSAFVFTPQNSQHVFYRTDAGRLQELYWTAAAGWRAADLTTTPGAALPAGAPSAFVFSPQSSKHVVFRTFDGRIQELYWTTSTGWRANDLWVATGSVESARAAGDPFGYAFPAAGSKHVLYRSADGHVQELYWTVGTGWRRNDLTVLARAASASGNPHGYVFAAQRSNHVVYRTTAGRLQELYWTAAGGWRAADLSATPEAVAPAGNPFGYAFEAQNTQHVLYRGTDGSIRELYWDAVGGWRSGQRTIVSSELGDPPAGGDPRGYVFGAQSNQHVFYRAWDGALIEMFW